MFLKEKSEIADYAASDNVFSWLVLELSINVLVHIQ